MTHPVIRQDLRFPSSGSDCDAALVRPADVDRPPVVVLGHGLGATREMGLDAYADRFAAAGIAALTFTYRHFGASGGEPRQLLSISRQLTDWDAALAHVWQRDDVDTARIAIWGSSFGGGHAILTAARHPQLRAAVAQCPFTDGVAAARAIGVTGSLRLAPTVARDLLARARGHDPVHIPLIGAPGTPALMSTPDSEPGYRALIPEGLRFVNGVAARIVPAITAHRPGRATPRIVPPILFCVCDRDTVAPPRATLTHARRAPRGEIRTYPVGHFDIYRGEPFEAVVTDQVAFLARHLEVDQT